MIRLAVFGAPVAHSLSPVMHTLWGGLHGLSLSYLRVRVERVERILPMAKLLELDGFNVTAPFKEAIVPYLSGIDSVSERLGAVNTVQRHGGGWFGFNTDPDGVRGELKHCGIKPDGQEALVIGAGGAGAAAALALLELGFKVTVVNRNPLRARYLAERLGISYRPWEELKAICARMQVIVVAAPIDCPEDLLNWLPDNGLIIEADYRNGALARAAVGLGRRPVMGGQDWLLHQGAAAFRHFTGIELRAEAVDVAAQALAREQAPFGAGHLCLIGLPGCGKSSVAAELSVRINRPCEDLDRRIVHDQGLAVDELFATIGESGFRECERQALVELLAGPTRVIAMGGGVVEWQENCDRLAEESSVVWLAVEPETALPRVAGREGRPLLARGDVLETLQLLHSRRRDRYAALARLVVDAQESIADITGGIHEEMA